MNRAHDAPGVPVGTSAARPWCHGLLRAGGLLLAVVLVYQPVWHAGFLWDDDALLTANPCIIGPQGLRDLWTSPAADICPLTLTTLWLLHRLWGLAPLTYHLATVALHGVGVILLWRVLRRARVPGAWLGAALWALHPVQVESVAWIAEIKNTQSGVFYLLAILCFLRWRGDGTAEQERSDKERRLNWPAYVLALLCTALALASKSSTLVLPLVFALLLWWREGRLRPRELLALAPFFALALASGLASLWTQFQPALEYLNFTVPQSVPARLVTMGKAVWFYLGKLAWPHPLMTIYPRWQIDPGRWSESLPLAAVLGVLLALWWGRRWAWGRHGWFVWAYFLVALLPVSGVVSIRFFQHSFVADHFVYLASMAPCALAGAGLGWLTERPPASRWPWVRTAFALVPLLVLGTLSRQQTLIYDNQVTLWTDAVSRNPNYWLNHDSLGRALAGQGKVNEAIGQYREALRISPDNADVRNDLGNILSASGQTTDAIAQYRAALDIISKDFDGPRNLGNTSLQGGRIDEAEFQQKIVSTVNPTRASIHNNLGAALLQQGRIEESIIQCRMALDIDPAIPKAHQVFGNALCAQGKPAEAVSQFEAAVKSAPVDASAHSDLGGALAACHRWQQALVQLREAVRLKPDDVVMQKNLAIVEAMARAAPGQP